MNITNFRQVERESLYEAWEHFKLMLCKCPYHGLQYLLQLQSFYNSLDGNLWSILDRTSMGAFMSKTYTEGCQLIKDMTMNSYMWSTEWFTCRAKSPIKNAVCGKDKFKQILVRLNHLKLSFYRLQALNQPYLMGVNVSHQNKDTSRETATRRLMSR